MNASTTLKNWRWWVMMLAWYPLAAPFAILQILLTMVGSTLMFIGQKVRDFADWELSNALAFVFHTKAVKRWVYRSSGT